MAEVFISYSWDSEDHNQKVLSLTNHLRENGFEAQIDKMLTQEETAPNFIKMMHSAMQSHPKVVVVLSSGYKQKAESFSGGVGEEYQLLLNDIKSHPKKYILVSFAERSEDITPFGLQGRDIVDLSKVGEEERLFRKLLDEKEFEFSAVATEKPKISPKKIPTFYERKDVKEQIPIEISNFSIKQDGSSSLSGGLYIYADLNMTFDLKNISSLALDNYGVELRFNKFLDPKYYLKNTEDDEIVDSYNITDKLFPNQSKRSKIYNLRIAHNTILKVLNSKIIIKVFTDVGIVEKEYLVTDVIKIKPGGVNYSQPVPIRQDLFSY
jgi:SEFIR domain-containing protein